MNSVGLIESKGLVALIETTDFILKNSPIRILGIKNLHNGLLTLAVSGENEYVKVAVKSAVEMGKKVGEIFSYSIIENPDNRLLELFDEIFTSVTIDRVNPIKSKIEHKILKEEITIEKSPTDVIPLKNIIKPEKIVRKKKEKIVSQVIKPEEKQVTKESDTQKISIPVNSILGKAPTSTIARLRSEALGVKKEKTENRKRQTAINIIENPIVSKQNIDFEAIKKMNVHKLRHYARNFNNFPIKGREISRANREELVELFNKIK